MKNKFNWKMGFYIALIVFIVSLLITILFMIKLENNSQNFKWRSIL